MTFKTTLSVVALCTATTAFADGCDTVRFSDVGWTDITATTAATSIVLNALGYEATTDLLSVPVTYTSLAEGNIDVFLGNWMPTMEADLAPYRDAGTVEVIRTNLEGAKYTLATNEAGAAAGITDFNNIAAAKSGVRQPEAARGVLDGANAGFDADGGQKRLAGRWGSDHRRGWWRGDCRSWSDCSGPCGGDRGFAGARCSRLATAQ